MGRLGMRRKIYAANRSSVLYYLPWSDYIQQYESKAVSHAWETTYSKTKAIHDLQTCQSPDSQFADLLRALLTDDGLLFPRTRERLYTESNHSMRMFATGPFNYYYRAYGIESSEMSAVKRFLVFGKYEYNCRKAAFGETYPLISYEKVQQGIQTLLKGRDGPFYFEAESDAYPLGICKGDLSHCDYTQNPCEVEAVMERWINTTKFFWDDTNWLSAPSLKRELGFSTVELYEFLAYILPGCLSRERIYQILDKSQNLYHPSLNIAQRGDFKAQIERFKRTDFSSWKLALPVLKEYLHPNLDGFSYGCIQDDTGNTLLNSSQSRLTEAFEAYCSRMEPLSRKSGPQVQENRRNGLSRIAAGFLNSYPAQCNAYSAEESRPLFLDRPHLIFHLFRSPFHRYIFNFENRNWNFSRAVEEAYSKHPLPITNQSLQADTDLFRSIVEICSAECERVGLPFPQDAWNALWDCIIQTVRCLSFQEADLFSAKAGFIHVLYLGDMGSPVLDKWIEDQLSAEGPVYIPLWHAFMGKWGNLSRRKSCKWKETVCVYREAFESPRTDSKVVIALLRELCAQISWKGITYLPSPEDLSLIDSRIRPRSRSGPALAIRSGISAAHKVGADHKMSQEEQVAQEEVRKRDQAWAEEHFKCLWTEWLLVQCVSDQARRELMESVYLYLTAAEKDPI